MARAEIVSHFEQYAASFAAPIAFGREVATVDLAADGYRVITTNEDVYAATNVIVATGSFQFPKLTPLAQTMPEWIVQLHSGQYRRPEGPSDRSRVGRRERPDGLSAYR